MPIASSNSLADSKSGADQYESPSKASPIDLYTLLNPENGVIVNTNRNTEYRKELENNEVDFRNKLMEIEDLKRWKEGVTRALWIIFGILATVVIRMILMHSEQG